MEIALIIIGGLLLGGWFFYQDMLALKAIKLAEDKEEAERLERDRKAAEEANNATKPWTPPKKVRPKKVRKKAGE